MDKINFDHYLALVKAEVDLVFGTVKEKGANRFAKALILALLMVGLSYMGVYAPPKKKLGMLAREIAKRKSMSEYGAQYKDLRDQLAGIYSNLPALKEREQWLSQATIESLRAESLTPESFRPVTENEATGLVFQSTSVQISFKFHEFFSWLVRLERSKPLMHVQSIEIAKIGGDRIGVNQTSCEIVTVIPLKRYN